MKSRTDLGPGCPVCGSGEWRLADPRGDFHADGVPLPEVTAEAVCSDCGVDFYLDLSISDDSIWRSSAVPRSMGPLIAFGWLDDVLYAAGRTLKGNGSHYHEEYRLTDVWATEE
ncbi:MAG: hypothetical protein ABEJ68_02905 [Halobacteriaceae archaeon]